MKRIFSTLSQKWPEYLLEVLVITMGILGAYMLNDWKETQDNRAIEKTYLIEINQEFKENRTQFEEVIKLNKGALASCQGLLREYEKENPNPDSLLVYQPNAWYTYSFDPSQSSIQSLVNTSSLYLIKNPELRKLLVSWSDLVKDYQQEETNATEHVFNNILPYITRTIDSIAFQNGEPYMGPIEMEFRNMIILRIIFLNLIFESEEKELEKVRATMSRIIALTETKK